MGFKDEMEKFDEQFDEDKEKPVGNLLDDGTYPEAILTEQFVDHDDQNDRYALVWKFEATDPRGNPGSIRKWSNLDDEMGRQICAQDLKRFGYEGKLSELEEMCEAETYIGCICEIKIKTKPGRERDFKNVYINKVLGKGEVPVASGSATADDDIPF